MGNAKSYAERLFNFPEIDALPGPAAERAIRGPLEKEGVDIDEAALADRLTPKEKRYLRAMAEPEPR